MEAAGFPKFWYVYTKIHDVIERVGIVTMFLSHNQEVYGSILGWDTGHPD
jgi:hypothetical protein